MNRPTVHHAPCTTLPVVTHGDPHADTRTRTVTHTPICANDAAAAAALILTHVQTASGGKGAQEERWDGGIHLVRTPRAIVVGTYDESKHDKKKCREAVAALARFMHDHAC